VCETTIPRTAWLVEISFRILYVYVGLCFSYQTEKSGRSDDDMKRDQMEKLVREELERWDSEASMNRADSRGPSPSASRVNTAKSSRSTARGSAQSSAGSVRVPVHVSVIKNKVMLRIIMGQLCSVPNCLPYLPIVAGERIAGSEYECVC